MREWEVWREGYACTGQSEGAYLLGKATAETFIEACRIVCKDDKDYQESNGRASTWACQLFDNEEDARRWFG